MKLKVDAEIEVPDDVGAALLEEPSEDQPQQRLVWPVTLADGYSYNVQVSPKWVEVE